MTTATKEPTKVHELTKVETNAKIIAITKEICASVDKSTSLCRRLVKTAIEDKLSRDIVYDSLLQGGMEKRDKSYASKIASVATNEDAATLLIEHKVGINLCYSVACAHKTAAQALAESKSIELAQACKALGVSYDKSMEEDDDGKNENSKNKLAHEPTPIEMSVHEAGRMIDTSVDYFCQEGIDPKKLCAIINKSWKKAQGDSKDGIRFVVEEVNA